MESYENHMGSKPFNTLGLIGFIFSLTCILAPLGLLLSFIALFKPAKGFAIAGLIIGLLFSIVIGGFAGGIAALQREAKFESYVDYCGYGWDLLQLQEALNLELMTSKQMPESPKDLEVEDGARIDPWGKEYRFEVMPDVYDHIDGADVQSATGYRLIAVRTAGPDGQWDTDDDRPIKLESSKALRNSPFLLGYLITAYKETKPENGTDEDK